MHNKINKFALILFFFKNLQFAFNYIEVHCTIANIKFRNAVSEIFLCTLLLVPYLSSLSLAKVNGTRRRF